MQTVPFYKRILFKTMATFLVAMAPLVAVQVWLSLSMQRDAVDHGRSLMHRAVYEAAAEQDAVAADLRRKLAAAATDPALRGMNPYAIDDVLHRLVQSSPVIGNAFVCDLQGNIVASAVKPFAGVRTDHRRYFVEALRRGAFAAGDFVIGGLTGAAAMHFAQPVRDESGHLAGIAAVAVNLEWYQRLFEKLEVPRGAFLAFFDCKGALLARYPASESFKPGDRFPELFQEHFSWRQPSGSFVVAAPGGVETLYAYKILNLGQDEDDAYGVMFVGMPATVAQEAARHRMLTTMAASAGSVVLTVLLGALLSRVLFVRRMQVLAEFAESFSKDRLCKLPPRFGSDEIGALGRLMVDMSLELREKNERLGEAMASLGQERDALAGVVAELRQAKEELVHRADYDVLTGLKNRRCFLERLGEEMARLHRYGSPFSLIILDIDDFKNVNDTYGHGVGDTVLRVLGETLRAGMRQVDEAFRVGGEEFAVVLPETVGRAALLAAEQLRQAVAVQAVSVAGLDVFVTVSLGVAEASPGMDAEKDLFAAADRALYAAKRTGKNRSVLDGADAPAAPAG